VFVLSWNLFHGRDAPPNRALRTRRSRLLRVTERDATHAQVNRSLLDEFAAVLARVPWEVALLQEAPPHWLTPLCRRLEAHGALALTARNLAPAVRRLAVRANPDLVGAWEGGSNQLLVRPPWRIAAVRRVTLARRPERRRMLWARLTAGDGRALCVANVHLSVAGRALAAHEAALAAAGAVAWAGPAPLVFGGDLNLAPESSPTIFSELRERVGLKPPTAPDAIDHILARGLEPTEAPQRLAPAQREVPASGGLALRLSDHAPVVGRWGG
jgi:endonuclease/exonuclease/phosphatase family metal-dependent hydrolase